MLFPSFHLLVRYLEIGEAASAAAAAAAASQHGYGFESKRLNKDEVLMHATIYSLVHRFIVLPPLTFVQLH